MANLTALLDSEASVEIESILSEARHSASEILDKAKAEAEQFFNERQKQVASQTEAQIVRARSAAQLEASSLKLRMQHEAVESVFSQVKDKISALLNDSTAYGAALEKLLQEAVDAIGGKLSNITVHPDDKDSISAIAGSLGLDAAIDTDASLSGGVKVKAEGSNISITNSLFDRLDSLRDELGSEVSKLLFAKGA